jgi:hypothetical protein
MADEPAPITRALDRLRRDGWSCGDTAFHAEGSRAQRRHSMPMIGARSRKSCQ